MKNIAVALPAWFRSRGSAMCGGSHSLMSFQTTFFFRSSSLADEQLVETLNGQAKMRINMYEHKGLSKKLVTGSAKEQSHIMNSDGMKPSFSSFFFLFFKQIARRWLPSTIKHSMESSTSSTGSSDHQLSTKDLIFRCLVRRLVRRKCFRLNRWKMDFYGF